MFAKPYKLKSNTTLKNSEKKHLSQRIQDEFPSVTEEKAKELVPVKSSCICMKLVLYSGDLVNVYAVDGIPMVIETPEQLVPTVCALWKVPDLVPVLTIHTPVLAKMQGGAPLYLPGLEIPAGGVGFPLFQRGAVIAMCTTNNAAAAVVGRATISSADMLLRAAGICFETIQVLGDQLCKDIKFSKIERPQLRPPSYRQRDCLVNLSDNIAQLSMQPAIREEWPSLVRSTPVPLAKNEPTLIAEDQTNPAPEMNHDQTLDEDETMIADSSQVEDDIPTDMDGLLRWCFLSFLKLEGKSIELPLKTNLLYKNHLIALCPEDRTLDVKKSSYKKLGKFLEAMQTEGLVEVREIEKGVSALTAVCANHPLVRQHAPLRRPQQQQQQQQQPGSQQEQYIPPVVREMYCVTAHVVPLLAPHRKGTALTAAEVRAAVTQYVRSRSLTAAHSGTLTLDAALAQLLAKREQETVKWDELMTSVLSRMTASTEMRFADGSCTLSKTRLEPIQMQVATRSGNKKVTLVSNLQSFGFSLPALSRVCQLAVAASCGVTRSPGAKADQLMLQGDQTHFIAKLLIEKYGLPKKFVEGADKALNKKK